MKSSPRNLNLDPCAYIISHILAIFYFSISTFFLNKKFQPIVSAPNGNFLALYQHLIYELCTFCAVINVNSSLAESQIILNVFSFYLFFDNLPCH